MTTTERGFSGIECSLYGILDSSNAMTTLRRRLLEMGVIFTDGTEKQIVFGPTQILEDGYTGGPRTSSLIQLTITDGSAQRLTTYRAGDFAQEEQTNHCNVNESLIFQGDAEKLLATLKYTYHHEPDISPSLKSHILDR